MTVQKITPLGFASNCYLLSEDGKRAVAIDPAQPRVLKEAEKLGLKIEYVLLTHGHFDHVGGCAALQAAGAKIGCLKEEEELALHHNLGHVPRFTVDFTFQGGDKLSLLGMEFEVIATPGHTGGSACYLVCGSLFTGDTLFAGDVGRTDLPTGSEEALIASLKKLCAIEQDCPVYAGHGKDSTLAHEKKYNRYL